MDSCSPTTSEVVISDKLLHEALSFFAQEPALEGNVEKISQACSIKGVISTWTYERIRGAPSGKRKVMILVNGIEAFIRANTDGFGVFLYLLRSTSCEELARNLEVLLAGATERTCKAQATSKKTTKVNRQRERIKAIKKNWDNLVKVCEKMLNPIASDCLTKKIITKKVYQEATKKNGDKKARTEHFLKCICTAISKDSTSTTFEVFLKILKKRRTCGQVAKEIEFGVVSRSELVLTPASTLPPREQVVVATDLPMPFAESIDSSVEGRIVVPESHGIQELASGAGGNDVALDNKGSVQSLKSCKQRMEERRIKEKENEKLKEEKYRILLDIEGLKKELSEKQVELRDKELEKDKLTEEVQTLEIAIHHAKETDQVKVLKTRIAAKEKDIEAKDKNIQALEKEKKELMKELSEKNLELTSTKEILQYTQQALHEFRRLSHQQSKDCEKIRKDYWYIKCFLFVLLIFCILLFLYIFFVL